MRRACKPAALLSAVWLIILASLQLLQAQPLPCPPLHSSRLDIGPDTVLCVGSCIQLRPRSVVSTLRSTDNYRLNPIDYRPFPYSGGTPVLTNMDDIWSGEIPLPFEFCFFGKKYQSCVIGANGNVSFDNKLANVTQPYSVFPAPYNDMNYNNCIMGAYYDLNPAKGGQISYAVHGVAPCRTFVVSWNDIPLYKCDWLRGTQQIVLYESTYAIEVFVKEKPVCPIWEGGNGVLGIQNEDGSKSGIFSGRNCVPWTESNQGYRFTPDGAPDISYKWINVTTGIAIAATDTFTICPDQSFAYCLQATLSSQCDALLLSDTIAVKVMHFPSTAAFDYVLRYGCTEDTLICANLSAFGSTPVKGPKYRWDFGDGSTDTLKHPLHLYARQGVFQVQLTTMGDSVCSSSSVREIDTRRQLKAAFGTDRDSLCGSGSILFSDSSKVDPLYGIAPSYYWSFNDGSDDITRSPAHHFDHPGLYVVRQIVGNGIPCYDTGYRIIRVDSIPVLQVSLSDTLLCSGAVLEANVRATQNGLKALLWSFGEGSTAMGKGPVRTVYEHAGTYSLQLKARYEICPELDYAQTIHVRPTPSVYLGPDTTLCPGMNAIYLYDAAARDTAGLKRMWSNGERNAGIWVDRLGEFSLAVTQDGCTGYDTIAIKKGCYINIPNAFSPDGDGENDRYLPMALLSKDVVGYRMQIFNRWGQLVYESDKNNSSGWDGSYHGVAQPVGVYIYLIQARFLNGEEQQFRGNLTLLR